MCLLDKANTLRELKKKQQQFGLSDRCYKALMMELNECKRTVKYVTENFLLNSGMVLRLIEVIDEAREDTNQIVVGNDSDENMKQVMRVLYLRVMLTPYCRKLLEITATTERAHCVRKVKEQFDCKIIL